MGLVPGLYPALCDPMDYSPAGSSVHGILHARILVGCHWGIFPTQRSNSGLLHRRHILYHLSRQGSPLPTCFTSKCTKIYLSLVPLPLLLFRILNSQILLNGLSSRFSEPSSSPNCRWLVLSNLFYSHPSQPPHPEWEMECARASPSFMTILLFPHCLAPSAPSLPFGQACRFSNLSSNITWLWKSFLPSLSWTRGHSPVIL